MTSQSRVRVAVLTGAAAAMAAAACGDPYAPTNPYDPETAVQFTITGPETLFSLGEAGRFAALTVPAFSDTSFVWTVDTFYNDLKYLLGGASPIDPGSNVLAGDGTGTYGSIAPPFEPNVCRVGGRKPGSTWVVATRGALADSLQIVVH